MWIGQSILYTLNLSCKPHHLALSFGQQKRISIAAVLAMRSRILMMDEPTAGQDYWNYLAFMDSILQMPGFDAILFITHDVDLAVIYANRIILLYDGAIVADGSPNEVLADEEQLSRCRVLPTSLAEAQPALFSKNWSFFTRRTACACFITNTKFKRKGENQMNKKLWQFGTREVVFAAIGAALYGVLAWATNFLQISLVPEMYPSVPRLPYPCSLESPLDPSLASSLVSLGNIIGDLLSGYGFWFWWDLGNGIQAMIPGLILLTIVNYKDFGSIIKAEIMVVIGIIVGMGLAALSEMWVSGIDFPTTVAVNFMPAFITNIIWGLVLVPILMVAYSAIQSRSGR